MSEKMTELSAKYPSFFILCGILAGIIPGINNWLLLFVPLAVLPVIIFFTGKRNLVRFLIGLAVGLCSMLIRQHTASDNYATIIGRANCGAEIQVEICDTSCAGNIDWLPNPNLVFCEVRKLRYSPTDTWQKASGKLAVRFPREFRKVYYGDNLCLLGSFILPDSDSKVIQYTVTDKGVSSANTGDLSGFDFNGFLKARGVSRVFYAREGNIIDHTGSLTGGILQVRDFLLKHLCDGMPDGEPRKLLAALIFGCKQGLDYQTKQEFIKTGTIHIFTVSGFHVGVLALMIFWLLRWLPFKTALFSGSGNRISICFDNRHESSGSKNADHDLNLGSMPGNALQNSWPKYYLSGGGPDSGV